MRWAPRGACEFHTCEAELTFETGDILASAGDDGNVILWALDEGKTAIPAFGGDGIEDKEVWRPKHMCRSSGAEIYDLAWSPDAMYFIIGSMDNVARIYNAQTGISSHTHGSAGQYEQNTASNYQQAIS